MRLENVEAGFCANTAWDTGLSEVFCLFSETVVEERILELTVESDEVGMEARFENKITPILQREALS